MKLLKVWILSDIKDPETELHKEEMKSRIRKDQIDRQVLRTKIENSIAIFETNQHPKDGLVNITTGKIITDPTVNVNITTGKIITDPTVNVNITTGKIITDPTVNVNITTGKIITDPTVNVNITTGKIITDLQLM